MKENPSLNRRSFVENVHKMWGDPLPGFEFLRNGNVGQWHKDMSEEMIRRFDEWISENLKM